MATLAGFFIYITWKEKESEDFYLEKLGTVQAQTHSKNIIISPLVAVIGKEHPFKNKPIIEGKIENRGNWTIKHLVLKASFLNFKNESMYDVEFSPLRYILKKENTKIPFIEMLIREEELPLKPYEKAEFTFTMENCPRDLLNAMGMDKQKFNFNFSKPKSDEKNWSGKLKYKILRLRFF